MNVCLGGQILPQQLHNLSLWICCTIIGPMPNPGSTMLQHSLQLSRSLTQCCSPMSPLDTLALPCICSRASRRSLLNFWKLAFLSFCIVDAIIRCCIVDKVQCYNSKFWIFKCCICIVTDVNVIISCIVVKVQCYNSEFWIFNCCIHIVTDVNVFIRWCIVDKVQFYNSKKQ